MAHPRAKLTVAGRRLLVERVLEQGWPPVRAAEAQGWPEIVAELGLEWHRLGRCPRPQRGDGGDVGDQPAPIHRA
jgi:leucine-zipper of insertion element IS481